MDNNDIALNMATEAIGLDHFILGLDDDGNEVKIKIDPTGELVQDIDDKEDEIILN